MQLLLVTFVLLVPALNTFSAGYRSIQRSIQNDLRELNATCPPFDSCMQTRKSDSLDEFACHCGEICTQLGTCCVDSPYTVVTSPKVKTTCRSVNNGKSYFMVDHCRPFENKDIVFESLCEDEWDSESDVLKVVPVTSLQTNITYKNYFCFRCHEVTDKFLYWNVILGSDIHKFDQRIDRDKPVSVNYDLDLKTWMAPLGQGGTLIPINMRIEIPEEILILVVSCQSGLISDCHEMWSNQDARDKCDAYMGAMSIEKNGHVFKYRNVHCALCNFELEHLKNMTCKDLSLAVRTSKLPFSFSHLLDINRSDGDFVGKIQKCENNFLWDPFSHKCRKLTCALPGFAIRNGKCRRL